MAFIDWEKYKTNGYLIIDTGVSSEILKDAQIAFKEIYHKVHRREYPYVRVYDDYIGYNLAGIDIIFHPDILKKRIIAFLNNSNLMSIVDELLGNRVKMTLSRYHVTGKYSHIGMWHRDAIPESIQVNISLFDEQGIEAIPGSHNRENTEEENKLLSVSNRSLLPESVHLRVEKGQMLIFNPVILHRGISEKQRANIHFRFEKDNSFQVREEWGESGFDSKWCRILDNVNSKVIDNELKAYVRSSDLRTAFLRILRTCIHYGLFFLPVNSRVFLEFSVFPSLKLRRIFHIYK